MKKKTGIENITKGRQAEKDRKERTKKEKERKTDTNGSR